jgi:lysophospholipase L1-like esterase
MPTNALLTKTAKGVLLLALCLGLVACAPGKLSVAKNLSAAAQAYTAAPPQAARSLLVVGDSTGVGTGASSAQTSLAGLIGKDHPHWRIDNLAVNGAKFEDVVEQLAQAQGGYDMVLVLAGGNDVMRGTSQKTLRTHMEQAIGLAQLKGRHVVLMPCGDVGLAPFFWPPLSWWMSSRAKDLHATAKEVAHATGITYVRLLKPRENNPFVLRSDELHAADSLHPSDAGYQQWYEELQQQGGLAPMLQP